MNIRLNEDNIQQEEIIKLMKEAGELCLEEEGLPFDDTTEVSISFVSPLQIKELNAAYRDKDSETDVLSFPQYETLEEMKKEKNFLCLGDIIICPQIAAIQADECQHSLTRELVYLMVHSMFHLLGYDHQQEEQQRIMRKKEEKIMEKIGVTRT